MRQALGFILPLIAAVVSFTIFILLIVANYPQLQITPLIYIILLGLAVLFLTLTGFLIYILSDSVSKKYKDHKLKEWITELRKTDFFNH